jgi:hypothetical protein
MKRLMVFAAFVSLVALVPVYGAEIYWDTPPGDAEITDKDFKYEYQGITPAKSLRERDVYFNPGDPPPDWATDLYESDQPAGTPAQPRIRDTTPRPRVTAPAAPQTDRRAPMVAPRQAETSPGTTQSIVLPPPEPTAPAEKKKPQTKRAQRDASGTQAVEKPEGKKLRWGQTETKTPEDKSKFQWGQPK